jgi:cathepsin A (carboxypeptidase C)
MRAATPECVELIKACNHGFGCGIAQEACNLALIVPVELTGINLYDIREQCTNPPLCGDFSAMDKFLNLQSTREALNTVGKRFFFVLF